MKKVEESKGSKVVANYCATSVATSEESDSDWEEIREKGLFMAYEVLLKRFDKLILQNKWS